MCAGGFLIDLVFVGRSTINVAAEFSSSPHELTYSDNYMSPV